MKKIEQAEPQAQPEQAAQEPVRTEEPVPIAAKELPKEMEYSLQELVAGAEALGIKAECMLAALRTKGLKSATKRQAAEAVQSFLKRKVK